MNYQPDEFPRLLSTNEVCDILGVSRWTLQTLRERGSIQAVNIAAKQEVETKWGNRFRYRAEDVNAFINKRMEDARESTS